MEKTECEWQDEFINSNTDIALKYIMWKDMQLEPQVFNNQTNIDADDTDFEYID